MFLPETPDDELLSVSYEYGKIRNVYKGDDGDLAMKYRYETNSTGDELTLITEYQNNEVSKEKTYIDGNLQTTFELETKVLTRYTYGDHDRVKEVTLETTRLRYRHI